ncbi:VOC family protein [Granulicella mallensis]|uniref:Glyoxalase/bleomycin resistance protein/dioxygenase n=1 Tax=Granulicella mallensis (strain ATCC BAA-1857 / DSM 23137 / MP5ACTX8) TaxID=682795 RepID=G8NUY9_GRAMM|nr:VOC family protein [Granulicella mallensis]AEU38759.1 Glyoxalase/bleomycin resistance protein/dioxygenase [Granulicella mallensis MP5ACTX8]
MLGTHSPALNLAVRDLEAARRFYAETLGLTQVSEMEGLIDFRSGNVMLYVYQSEFAGTNQATAATWSVGEEIEAMIATLKSRGVSFEHYTNIPGLAVRGDIHVGDQPDGSAGEFKVAWFRDPDGNLLSLTNGRSA